MKFTQRMAMHINGGGKYSVMTYNVFADGKETNITRGIRTNGSPQYKVINDEFHCGDETFDNLEAKGVVLEQWLEQHVAEASK